MKLKLMFILLFAGMFSGCNCPEENTNAPKKTEANATVREVSQRCSKRDETSRGYKENYGPPKWWERKNAEDPEKYPIFKMNYDPGIASLKIPETCTNCPWKSHSFKKEPVEYLKEVIKYAFEGNLEVDWRVEKNAKGRKWYHAPYMHLDVARPNSQACVPNTVTNEVIDKKVAREYIHGLTMERPTRLSDLTPHPNPGSSSGAYQNWAVSFYNEIGASYIAKVWNEVINPAAGFPDPNNILSRGFPDGTVAIKLLFTQASGKEVSYLGTDERVQWYADTGDPTEGGHNTGPRVKEKEVLTGNSCENNWESCFSKLHLLQVDVAVRDDRKENETSPTGWVFGTFTYNDAARPFIDYESPEKDRNNPWLRIQPLGVMFGSDPGVKLGQALKETVLLSDDPPIPTQHYGCGKGANRRLNGPVDRPASSCISCHIHAEIPHNLDISDIPSKEMYCGSDDDILTWFRNINPRDVKIEGRSFTPSAYSLDFSLQLREGIRRYCVDSYNNGDNACRLSSEKIMNVDIVTRDGIMSLNEEK